MAINLAVGLQLGSILSDRFASNGLGPELVTNGYFTWVGDRCDALVRPLDRSGRDQQAT